MAETDDQDPAGGRKSGRSKWARTRKARLRRAGRYCVDIITSEVSNGGAVTLPGVGKIYCRERPARMVRNPATGEQIHKDADKVVKMTIAKALKDSVNG